MGILRVDLALYSEEVRSSCSHICDIAFIILPYFLSFLSYSYINNYILHLTSCNYCLKVYSVYLLKYYHVGPFCLAQEGLMSPSSHKGWRV